MHKIPRSYTDNNYDEYGGNEYTKYTDSRNFFCYIYAAFLPLIEDLSCVFLEKYSAYKNQLLPNFKRNETRMQRLSHFISYV